eukprot:3941129-Rhodomonas_salina.3
MGCGRGVWARHTSQLADFGDGAGVATSGVVVRVGDRCVAVTHRHGAAQTVGLGDSRFREDAGGAAR